MPWHFFSYYLTLYTRKSCRSHFHPTKLICTMLPGKLEGSRHWRLCFLACEIVPSAVVYKLSGIKRSKQHKLCKRRTVYSTAAQTMSTPLCPTAAANGHHHVLRIQSNRGFNTLIGLGKHIPSCAIERQSHNNLSLGLAERVLIPFPASV